jgi:hypothetical protein
LTTLLYPTGLLHDTLAYVLLASITCLASVEPDAGCRLRRSGWWAIAFADDSSREAFSGASLSLQR